LIEDLRNSFALIADFRNIFALIAEYKYFEEIDLSEH